MQREGGGLALERLQLRLLGGFQLSRQGRAGDGLAYEKARALLAFLAMEADLPHSRKMLAEWLWPEFPLNAALANLRIVLLDLRKAVNTGTAVRLNVDRNSVSLVASGFSIDVSTFMLPRKHCACIGAPLPCGECIAGMEARSALYQGDFLASFSLPDCPDFDDWLQLQREALRQVAIRLHAELAGIHELRGDIAAAMGHAQRHVAMANWDEAGHRRLIRLLAQSGQPESALAQFERCRSLLNTELGVQPGEETRKLAEIIARGLSQREAEREPLKLEKSVARALVAERRQVTVLYCELLVPNAEDPDEVLSLLYPVQQRWVELLVKFSGHVVQTYTGGLLAYFGYPSASEHAVRDAMRAACALVEDSSAGVAFRIGIHTGPVVCGGSLPVPDIVGTTTSLAIRLRLLASPGEIAVSAEAASLVEGFFSFVPLGRRAISGIPKQVEVFHLVGQTSAAERVAAAERLTPLVGRVAELRMLFRLWNKARRGHRQFVLVCGEAGIGKSRLLAEFRGRLSEEQLAIRELRCAPEFSCSPFQPLIRLIEDVLDFSESDDEAARRSHLTSYFASRHPGMSAGERQAIATLLSLGAAENMQPCSPDAQRDALLSLMPRLLGQLSTNLPLLLLVEDVHWIDPSTLELLQRVMSLSGRAQILVVFTARPEFVSPWPAQLVPIFKLARLADDETYELVALLAPDLPPSVLSRLVERADGIPLFAEELADIASTVEDGEVPTTLKDLLTARLDSMGEAKSTAQLGAIIGRAFSGDLLCRISPLPAEVVDRHLLALAAANLIVAGRNGGYQFRHALIRDAAYQSQPKAARQTAHRLLAEVLQRSSRTHPEAIANHYGLASEWGLAVTFWLRAGNQAGRHSANREAMQHFQAGLKLIDKLPEGPGRKQFEFDLQNGLGVAAIAVEGYASVTAAKAHERAALLCELQADGPDMYRALWGLWASASSRAGYGHAFEMAQRLLRLAEFNDDNVQIQQAHFALGNTLFWQGRLVESRQHLEAALERYRPMHRTRHLADFGEDLRVTAGSYLSWVLELAGQPGEARRVIGETLTYARQIHHPYSLGYALTFAGLLYCRLHEPAQALSFADETLTLASIHDFPLWRIGGNAVHGWAQAVSGSNEGLDAIRGCIDATRPVMSGATLVILNLLAEAALARQCYQEALEAIEMALAMGSELDDHHVDAELLRMQGESLLGLSLSNALGARECFRKAQAIACEQSANGLLTPILEALAALGEVVPVKSRGAA